MAASPRCTWEGWKRPRLNLFLGWILTRRATSWSRARRPQYLKITVHVYAPCWHEDGASSRRKIPQKVTKVHASREPEHEQFIEYNHGDFVSYILT
jgi:hypothetical protein